MGNMGKKNRKKKKTLDLSFHTTTVILLVVLKNQYVLKITRLTLYCHVSFQVLKILGWSKLMFQQLNTLLLLWWLRRFFRVESFLQILTSVSTGILGTFQVFCQLLWAIV